MTLIFHVAHLDSPNMLDYFSARMGSFDLGLSFSEIRRRDVTFHGSEIAISVTG